jgi:hypothetical protein
MYALYNQEDMPKMELLDAPAGPRDNFQLSFNDTDSDTDSVSHYRAHRSVSQRRNSYSHKRSNSKSSSKSAKRTFGRILILNRTKQAFRQ